MKQVVKLLIKSEMGKVLLIRRSQTDTHGGKWETAGGGVDDGETIEEAASREALEETGLNLTFTKLWGLPDKVILTDDITGEPYEVHMLQSTRDVDKELVDLSNNPDHSDYIWLDVVHLRRFLAYGHEIDRWTLTQFHIMGV